MNFVTVFELIAANGPFSHHPFHLHGFSFHVMGTGQPFGPTTNTNTRMTVDYLKQLDENNQLDRNTDSPPGKDTIPVPNNGYVLLRFRANNPGIHLSFPREINNPAVCRRI